ncbi:MAG: glycerol acyltransferase [Bacteroidales bacterium]|nr:glycerol acyltransferase [Bacteroidales bacterium]
METIAGKVLDRLGWKITGDFPDIKKSIIVFAPHTAHIDAFYGKLGITELGINYKFLSKKELFFFPMNLVMKKFGSIAVRGVKNQNAIYQVAELLNNSDELHIVISPEGWIKKVSDWNKGFYYMALKANVPIIVASLDYKVKEMGIKGVIYEIGDYYSVINQINSLYNGVSGKRPDQFVLQTAE